MGHATRAAAILRQVRRLGHRSVLALTNARLPLALEHERIPFLRLPDDSPDVLRGRLHRELARLRPRVLVVDVFPSGLHGELLGVLPRLQCRKVLVYRHVQPRLAEEVAAARSLFDRVLLAEEPAAPLAGPTVECWPILLRDADELLPRSEAKARLGVRDRQTVALGVSSEDPAWTRRFFGLLGKAWQRLQPRAVLRLATPHRLGDDLPLVHHYPLVELFNGVEVVVGPSGYNLFHEAQACGLETVFLPRPRAHDDQFWRARAARVADSPEALERLLAEALEAARFKPTSPPRFANGAATAARAIVELLR
jgi:hypothetical protein